MVKKIGIILGVGILLFIVLFGWWILSRTERGTTGLVSTHFRLARTQRQDRSGRL